MLIYFDSVIKAVYLPFKRRIWGGGFHGIVYAITRRISVGKDKSEWEIDSSHMDISQYAEIEVPRQFHASGESTNEARNRPPGRVEDGQRNTTIYYN